MDLQDHAPGAEWVLAESVARRSLSELDLILFGDRAELYADSPRALLGNSIHECRSMLY